MFNKKKIKQLEKKISDIEYIIDNLNSGIAVCEECGIVFRKDDMHKVTDNHYKYYYQKHKKKNDKIKENYNIREKYSIDTKYYITNIEVDKNGKVIKSKK